MRVFIKGSNSSVILNKSDFLASGGEGAVYAKGDTAYKLYTDPSKALPEGKIAELAAIADPNVIRPKDVLLNEQGHPLGYTMRYVTDTLALCQLFPRAFREREGLDHTKVGSLVLAMRKSVTEIHRAGVLVVDLNELNVLVSSDFSQAYWIDVDSYQTKHYPATAIMASVRDPLVSHNAFNEGSDWFSFGILAFQLFIGIHPFKGKHSTLKNFEDRMKAGISVFNSSVSVPKVCYPLDVIPEAYKSWFRAVFEEKKRLPPPADLIVSAVVQQLRTTLSTSGIDVARLTEWATAILQYFPGSVAGTDVVRLSDGSVHVGSSVVCKVTESIEVGHTPVGHLPVVAWKKGRDIHLFGGRTQIPFQSSADELASYDGRLFLRNRDKILEILLVEMQNADGTPKIIASTRELATVMEQSSILFSGGVVQNMLGSVFVSIFPRAKTSYQFRIPALDGYKILSAKYDRRVLMVVAGKKGRYSRFIFRFDSEFSKFDMREISDITPTGLNFVVLDTGVCVSMNEDETLEIFHSDPGAFKTKLVDDPSLGNDMRLYRQNGRVLFTQGVSLSSMRMK